MTNDQAILHLKGVKATTDSGQMQRAIDMAIEALNAKTRITVRPTKVNSYQPHKCDCGNAVMDDSNYCKKCGARLEWWKTDE